MAAEGAAVRFSLDEWMLRLHGLAYDDEQYVRLLPDCRALMLDTAAHVLRTGIDVVLDWNHFSPEQRAASAAWANEQGATYVVHHVTTSPDAARARLVRRNRAGEPQSHVIAPEELDHALTYCTSPTADEGHQVIRHENDERSLEARRKALRARVRRTSSST